MVRRYLDGEVVERGPVEIGRRSFQLSLKAQVALWLLGTTTRLIVWLVVKVTTRAHWFLTLIVVAGYLTHGVVGLILAAVVLAALLAVWVWRWPASFRRRVPQRARGVVRWVVVYRYRWRSVLSAERVKLAVRRRDIYLLPKIRYVRSTPGLDVVWVRMLPGQLLADWVEVSDRLAIGFDCDEDSCRVASVVKWRPSWVPARVPFPSLTRKSDIALTFLHRDPLAEIVLPRLPEAVPDFTALPVALLEDGIWWRLRLLGQHLFIAGATGAGKGSVLWSIIHQLSPAIPTGLVKPVALDPKGGVELGIGAGLFADFCRGRSTKEVSPEAQFADLLEKYVAVMRTRQDRMFGKLRLHKPTVEDPFIVLIIDELAALVAAAYQSDKEAGKRIIAAINILLSQGRAFGITLVGAVQDPRKDSVPMRGLFTVRVALRLNEAADVGLTLGEGARDRGAWCDKIRIDRQGTGYALVDSSPEPLRLRFPFYDDDRIRELARTHAAPGNLQLVPVVEGSTVDDSTTAVA
jgi:DNA segregation ATPase FtsK/SpoIIIE, S-DNA-T family